MDSSTLFRVDGIVAVISGGGTGKFSRHIGLLISDRVQDLV